MSVIASYIDLFAVSQPIYYVNNDSVPQLVASVPIDMVGSTVAQLCEKYQTEYAHLYGHENFLNSIVKTIQENNKEKYSNINITVEVN